MQIDANVESKRHPCAKSNVGGLTSGVPGGRDVDAHGPGEEVRAAAQHAPAEEGAPIMGHQRRLLLGDRCLPQALFDGVPDHLLQPVQVQPPRVAGRAAAVVGKLQEKAAETARVSGLGVEVRAWV